MSLFAISDMRNIFILLFCFCTLGVKAQSNAPIFEFRAAWIATVENIDWPSKKGLSTNEQKAEFISLLNLLQSIGMNAVIVQIRPVADAFYPSELEPWSEYLSGYQGKAPFPYYDPLAFMVEETHKRHMEFHAWLNPYRAVFNLGTSSISPNHIVHKHPDWFFNYAGKKYFNPGLPQARNFIKEVVTDIVKRYNLDAIHMDDYFYPYPVGNKEIPDNKAFALYGNNLSKADWRRSNCDSIINMLSTTIKSTNPRMKFGISPFGVWRNKSVDTSGSNTKAGLTNYDDLYADILLWLKKGWIDYVVPQLYWERGHRLCDYDTLLQWWNNHAYGRQLYIGHTLERVGHSIAWKNKNELPDEINHLRDYYTSDGSAFFSAGIFKNNPNGWNDSLQSNYYRLPALVPPMAWIDSVRPAVPVIIKLEKDKVALSYLGKQPIKGYAVFDISPLVEEKLDYATMIKIVYKTEKTVLNLNDLNSLEGDKIFVATISEGNNLSEWIRVN